MRIRRHIGIIILVIVIAAAIGYGFWPRPIAVDIAKAAHGHLSVTVEEEGRTRVIDRFVVSAPVAGFIRRINLDVGDRVTKGQALVNLEPLRSQTLDPRSRAEAEARVAATRSALRAAEESAKAAKAGAEFSKTQFKRTKGLFETDSVSQQEMDQAKTVARITEATLRSARFSVEVARCEMDAAQAVLKHSAALDAGAPVENVIIAAPVNGQALKVYRESEGVINAGESLMEIGDPRALEVEVDVLSADAVRIKPGTRVMFERWGGDMPLEGAVRLVEPTAFTKISALGVEEQRTFVIADITSPPEQWERLGDGYRVEASFIIWEADNALLIPASALFRQKDGWAVFVVEEGRARLRIVETGRRNGLVAQILSGLREGETVVNHPDRDIEDGARVQLR